MAGGRFRYSFKTSIQYLANWIQHSWGTIRYTKLWFHIKAVQKDAGMKQALS